MIRIIKFENIEDDIFNEILEDIQNNYHSQIFGIQSYGSGCNYIVTYECDSRIDKAKIVNDHKRVPLD